jgi:hypothetical protein
MVLIQFLVPGFKFQVKKAAAHGMPLGNIGAGRFLKQTQIWICLRTNVMSVVFAFAFPP